MKKQFGDYRRLARGLFSCSSLWAGPDHLVYVKGNGFILPFTEEYKRFRYEDIQAITMARTAMYAWSSTLFGIGAAAGAAIVFLPDHFPPVRIIMAVLFLPFVAVFLIGFIATIARGPSCRCRIQTAVGSVEIRPLTRMRTARGAIEAMSALVAARQEGLPGGVLDEAAPGGAIAAAGAESPATEASRRPKAPAETGGSGKMVRSRFLMPTLALMAPFGILWVAHANATGFWALTLLGVIEMVLFLGLAASLVEQMRGFTPSAILAVLWASMAQQVLLMAAAFAAYILWSIESSAAGIEASEISLGSIYVRAETSGFVYYFSMINALVSLFLCVTGFGLVWLYRSRMTGGAKPPPLSSTPSEAVLRESERTGGAGDE